MSKGFKKIGGLLAAGITYTIKAKQRAEDEQIRAEKDELREENRAIQLETLEFRKQQEINRNIRHINTMNLKWEKFNREEKYYDQKIENERIRLENQTRNSIARLNKAKEKYNWEDLDIDTKKESNNSIKANFDEHDANDK